MQDALIRTVEAVPPLDAVGEAHRVAALAWLRSTDDVYRRVKPATPDPHLVAYTLVVDRAARAVLLCDHRAAGLWLPPGGHVEPGEAPAETAVREVQEELGVPLDLERDEPFFLTVTGTAGDPAARHTDVSLWFAFRGRVDQALVPDDREFRGVRWWSVDELRSGDPAGFEPHLGRALQPLGL